MAVIDEVTKYSLIALTFEEITWTNTVSHLIGSNDGINWTDIKTYDFGWRDASIQYYKGWFYIVYSGGIKRTFDFEKFEDLGWPLDVDGKRTWAPEWFIDIDGSWKIIYTQTTDGIDESSFKPFYCNYNPDSNTVSNLNTPLEVNLYSRACIDLNLNYINGQYLLWLRDDDRVIRLYCSNNFSGPYNLKPTNFWYVQSGYLDEAPEMVFLNSGKTILYTDPWKSGNPDRMLNYSLSEDIDLTTWSPMNRIKGLDFNARHFGIYQFPDINNIQILSRTNLLISRINSYFYLLNMDGYTKQFVPMPYFDEDLSKYKYNSSLRLYELNVVLNLFLDVNELIGLINRLNIKDELGNFTDFVATEQMTDELVISKFNDLGFKNLNIVSSKLDEIDTLLKYYGIGVYNDGI